MRFVFNWWKNVSIAKKLYFVVGVMAVLIAGELLTLRFAMHTLSAVRAFVAGEGLWSKAQKDAIYKLQRYSITKNETDYSAFLYLLKLPEGDHLARVELEKPEPNLQIVRQGFLAGQIHADDIDPMVELLRRFYWISYLSQAIQSWSDADKLLFQMKDMGTKYHLLLSSDSSNQHAIQDTSNQIDTINEELTVIEDRFSAVLGDGSRWLEHIVISLLFIAVLTVESVGLTLTYVTSRLISRGLADLNEAANRIGLGDFDETLEVNSEDEIGQLTGAINRMGRLLKKSYSELETHVQERTKELSKAKDRAQEAISARDEFLSIASHELKTPITSIKLQLQMARRAVNPEKEMIPSAEELLKTLTSSIAQVDRITHLIEDLLDVSKIQAGKLSFNIEEVKLSDLVKNILDRFAEELKENGCSVELQTSTETIGHWDPSRIEQVIINLLTNAIKYAPGKPVVVTVDSDESNAILSVKDSGPGIPKEKQEKIFERFERATSSRNISGLGLGLFIVKKIVSAHQGSIVLNSEEGKGATFIVKLPLRPVVLGASQSHPLSTS